MSGRSTAVPKLAVSAGAGFIAVASIGALTASGHSTKSADSIANIAAESSTSIESGDNFLSDKVQSARADITYPIDEKWEEGKHATELRRLIVKKATSNNKLPASEAARLAALQRMRREALPMATSYEAFIRERERMDELERITKALMEYERKYSATANG